MSKLREYRRRRDFERTPEPAPGAHGQTDGALRFVVQAHAARAMHYDFRLQVRDVLVSWAVPKGPSLDPRDRRLALMTEDHPLEYATFEGIIPKGQYGGGSVIVWDEGTWEPDGDARAALKKGKLTFTLHGQKLKGRFHLTRTRARGSASGKDSDGNAWLLIKGRDDAAREGEPSIVEEAPASVISGRTLEQVARAPAAVWRSKGTGDQAKATGKKQKRPQGSVKEGVRKTKPKASARPDAAAIEGARRASFPRERRPQLATLVSEPPPGDGFIHEAKLDGYRLFAEVRAGKVKLWTRGEQDWTDQFPVIAEHLRVPAWGHVLLDGEVVAFDERGISRFQRLQNARSGRPAAPDLTYVVFDLLHLDGYDLTNAPLLARKAALSQLITSMGADAASVRFSEHVVGSGAEFFREACQLGLEGIVSKRVDAPYRSVRSQAWLKCKCLRRQEVVIGGYTDPGGSRSGLGALLVGLHDDDGKLHFVGKVGTGFSERSLMELEARLSKLATKTPPFVDPPRGAAARGVHWVRPELLAEVAFSEVTTDGKLRHPSFQGLRDDKTATQIRLEQSVVPLPAGDASDEENGAVSPTASSRAPSTASLRLPIPLTHPERVLYPDQDLTKRDLAEYYLQIAEWILPHVSDRLLTLVRCPAGQGTPCFYQKHAKDGFSSAVSSHALEGDDEPYVYVQDVDGLVSLVQVGVLEIHTWGSTLEHLETPDRLIFDLDPDPELEWARVVEGALDVRDELLAIGLQSFVKTTGGKGLHVTVPLVPDSDWTAIKAFCKAIAAKLARQKPRRYVSTMAKDKRTGKVFIDYLRNARGATAVVPYSTRARPGAPVATPITWGELERDVRGAFTLASVVERLTKQRMDPWPGFFDLRQTITPEAKRALRLD